MPTDPDNAKWRREDDKRNKPITNPQLFQWPTTSYTPQDDTTSHVDNSAQRPRSPTATEFSFIDEPHALAPVTQVRTQVAETTSINWDQLNEEWYGDLIRYYKHQTVPQG